MQKIKNFLLAIPRFFLAIPGYLRRVCWPYHCPKCGKHFEKMGATDFAPDIVEGLKRERLFEFTMAYSYQCKKCGITVMIA